jgi:ribosomal protein L11 methyltransferase
MTPRRKDVLMKRWLLLSLFVPRELGEGISNFLMEQGATGIEEVDEGPKWVRLKCYFLQDRKAMRMQWALRRYLRSLQRIERGASQVRIETGSISEQDWGESWKRFFKPVRATSRLVVKPPWSSVRLKRGQVTIDILPGMAFGTGIHATTKLCLNALESRKQKERCVLDVGAGSGILSIAAAKLGAVEVWGLDSDGIAVEVARENVKKNRVSDVVRMRKGTIGNIRRKFDTVVANIDPRNLRRMRMALLRHVKRGGFLILSGILEEEREGLLQHYWRTGAFRSVKATRLEEWACLTFQKKEF